MRGTHAVCRGITRKRISILTSIGCGLSIASFSQAKPPTHHHSTKQLQITERQLCSAILLENSEFKMTIAQKPEDPKQAQLVETLRALRALPKTPQNALNEVRTLNDIIKSNLNSSKDVIPIPQIDLLIERIENHLNRLKKVYKSLDKSDRSRYQIQRFILAYHAALSCHPKSSPPGTLYNQTQKNWINDLETDPLNRINLIQKALEQLIKTPSQRISKYARAWLTYLMIRSEQRRCWPQLTGVIDSLDPKDQPRSWAIASLRCSHDSVSPLGMSWHLKWLKTWTPDFQKKYPSLLADSLSATEDYIGKMELLNEPWVNFYIAELSDQYASLQENPSKSSEYRLKAIAIYLGSDNHHDVWRLGVSFLSGPNKNKEKLSLFNDMIGYLRDRRSVIGDEFFAYFASLIDSYRQFADQPDLPHQWIAKALIQIPENVLSPDRLFQESRRIYRVQQNAEVRLDYFKAHLIFGEKLKVWPLLIERIDTEKSGPFKSDRDVLSFLEQKRREYLEQKLNSFETSPETEEERLLIIAELSQSGNKAEYYSYKLCLEKVDKDYIEVVKQCTDFLNKYPDSRVFNDVLRVLKQAHTRAKNYKEAYLFGLRLFNKEERPSIRKSHLQDLISLSKFLSEKGDVLNIRQLAQEEENLPNDLQYELAKVLEKWGLHQESLLHYRNYVVAQPDGVNAKLSFAKIASLSHRIDENQFDDERNRLLTSQLLRNSVDLPVRCEWSKLYQKVFLQRFSKIISMKFVGQNYVDQLKNQQKLFEETLSLAQAIVNMDCQEVLPFTYRHLSEVYKKYAQYLSDQVDSIQIDEERRDQVRESVKKLVDPLYPIALRYLELSKEQYRSLSLYHLESEDFLGNPPSGFLPRPFYFSTRIAIDSGLPDLGFFEGDKP